MSALEKMIPRFYFSLPVTSSKQIRREREAGSIEGDETDVEFRNRQIRVEPVRFHGKAARHCA